MEKYIAKLTIKNLSSLEEIDLDRLSMWLEGKLGEVRDEYEGVSKREGSSEDPVYNKTYTSRLME